MEKIEQSPREPAVLRSKSEWDCQLCCEAKGKLSVTEREMPESWHRGKGRIIGQMFDYTSNAINDWSLDTIKSEFEAECTRSCEKPVQRIAGLTGEPGNNSELYYAFWDQVFDNLKNFRIRLIFIADVIPTELKRVIEVKLANIRESRSQNRSSNHT
jgi:hypothetical protein